jgi:sugar phosphate isomerase/epimerase
MRLPLGHHLAYCTNIHPGETWPETLAALEQYTLAVRARVWPDRPFAIGLRLSDQASRQLTEPSALLHFRRWLERNDCYVFTINGFPFGRFHGARVKERVYLPDWTSPERLEYTNRLFDLLAQLLPAGVAGSVSTVPGSFKEFITAPEQLPAIRRHLHACVKHIAEAAARAGRELHLGLEPEPLCLLETTRETVDFFDRLREEHPGDGRLEELLGVNYDTCHLAVEFEDAAQALALLQSHRVKISKFHLSNALKLRIADCGLRIGRLAAFADDTYLHQVIIRNAAGELIRYRDLADFLNPQSAMNFSREEAQKAQNRDSSVELSGSFCGQSAIRNPQSAIRNPQWEEARIHFHLPLHTPRGEWFDTTSDHLLGMLDALQASPNLCSHLEMETYTWQVLPPEWQSRSVVDQLAAEYEWALRELRRRGLA